ncbi:hypothetical protein GGI05_007048 [Coemansia sp. RSA 2603]|nr:hypothetical protein GGI05_007048 [Coemansia sp. RSA 2603]
MGLDEKTSGWLLVALLLGVIAWRVLIHLPWCPYNQRYSRLSAHAELVQDPFVEWETGRTNTTQPPLHQTLENGIPLYPI